MACHTLAPFSLPVSVASEHAENKWHATFLSLLLDQLRAYIMYSYLHVTLNSYHDWEHLLNILAPAIGPKSTSRLFHVRLITIRLPVCRFLLLSNLWLWLRLYICVLYFLFNCMLVLFSHFGYNEINIHTYILRERWHCWLGHFFRMDHQRIPQQALYWQVPGYKRGPGRPRANWRGVVNKDEQKDGVHLGGSRGGSSWQTWMASECGPMCPVGYGMNQGQGQDHQVALVLHKTIQQDLKSNNLSLNEATDVAQNRPLWDWCLRLALSTPSDACQKRKRTQQSFYQKLIHSFIRGMHY